MRFSRSARIKTLLVIDGAFFFLEIIVGYAVGSLALVADSFHMLNDVCSLIVALYALKLAEQTTRSNKYSYGWQRAEILGALINGVFLLALCFSIFLEAIQRMFGSPEVQSPKLVVVVGSLGLLSNIIGLFLFHDHGHSHGGHGHSHGSSHDAAAEEGHSHKLSHGRSPSAVKQNGHTHDHDIATAASERTPLLGSAKSAPVQGSRPMKVGGAETPFADDDEDEGQDTLDELLVHPAQTREAILRQAYDAGYGTPRNIPEGSFSHRRSLSTHSQSNKRTRRGSASTSQHVTSPSTEAAAAATATEDLARRTTSDGHRHSHTHTPGDGHVHEHDHESDEHQHGHEEQDHDDEHHRESHGLGHSHSHGQEDHTGGEDGHGADSHGHGHSHGNMNMRGVFLHVLGDALGNVGVIAAGLIIWLTKSPYRFYSDPIISFVITVIIFSSALPLVRSASFILLQGTPSHVPLEKVRSAILRIPNVVSVHDLHIWSLSESKLVASMHILVDSQSEFGRVSNEVRRLLHRFGVHSSTIQPELLPKGITLASGSDASSQGVGNGHLLPAGKSQSVSRQASIERLYLPNGGSGGNGSEEDLVCTVQCVDDSCADSACCPPAVMSMLQQQQQQQQQQQSVS